MKTGTLVVLLCLSTTLVFGANPILRIVRTAEPGQSLLKNGSVEDGGTTLANWNAAPNGFRWAKSEGQQKSHALACENNSARQYSGAYQTVALNRTNVAPIIVRGWSKADKVSGTMDNDYALYVDIVYQDGTALWGQTGKFRCGSHDWEQREFVIMPQKPVKTLTLHCLFRNHTGKVWFDDVSVTEVKTDRGGVLFEGQPMRLTEALTTRDIARASSYETRTPGLHIEVNDNAVSSLRVFGKGYAKSGGPSGFLARDIAANSDVFGFENGACADLGLTLKRKITAWNGHLAIEGRITDTTGKDRAVTLMFALPVDANGWHWGDDIRRSRIIQGRAEYANTVNVHCGATGTQSQYPLAAIYNENAGLALGIDLNFAAQYRIVYHPGAKLFYIAYDFGLVKDTERFPSSVDFRFVVYSFGPSWGFRGAFEQYMVTFPKFFEVRSKEQGIWMPFTDIKTVQGWEDFGFKYKEGNDKVIFDDTNNILTFRYTEPMTWWMAMKKEMPRTTEQAVRHRDGLAQGSNSTARLAQASANAGMFDEDGQPQMKFEDTPWCNGAVWSLNPNPYLPTEINGASIHWSKAVKERLYGPGAKGILDGEYLDSLEGYVTADLNYRREHFRYTTVPLTFSSESKRPALHKGLAVYEFTRWISGEVHDLGKLMFANGVPYRFTYLCPWLDVMGTETDWMRNGKYVPSSDSQMALWRTMSGAKPYVLLMNTEYEPFTPDLVEKYFQRCLFYGMFPSMFSHNASENPYWGNPKWYNRDRALFKKYIPLIKRIAEAGWKPINRTKCDNDNIYMETFGPDKSNTLYFTFYNDATTVQKGTMTFVAKRQAGPFPDVMELISGKSLPGTQAGWNIVLEPQQAGVIALQSHY